MMLNAFALIKQVAICLLIVVAGVAAGWFGRMLIEPSLHKAKAATAQVQAITKAAGHTNTIEKGLIHDQVAVTAAVAKAKQDMRAASKPVIAKPMVCPAAGYVIQPETRPDPDAEWRGYLRGINSVLDAASHDPRPGDDSAGGAG